MFFYVLTIPLSAFLLFQIQPLVGKYILPWFGGSPTVWTTCILFFQLLLLLGYLYAHLITQRLVQRQQVLVHVCLIAAVLLLPPITPNRGYKPSGAEDPVLLILFILATSVGLPYFLLATTGPLLQAWFRLSFPDASPYRLYALSNAGSLLALLTYPFIVEPLLRLQTQIMLWSGGLYVFAALYTYCAVKTWNTHLQPTDGKHARHLKGLVDKSHPPRPLTALLWLGLSACGSILLLAVTNQICVDVAVVPFLWVLPLSLYLLTFIICFQSERSYFRPVYWSLSVLAAGVMLCLLDKGTKATALSFQTQILGFSVALFICCMVCHGELVRLKPHPRYLTFFYLMVSAGGALGGILVTVVAPVVFSIYLEVHISLWACCALAMAAFYYESRLAQRRWKPWKEWAYLVLCLVFLGLFGELLRRDVYQTMANSISLTRNFYGTLNVKVENPGNPEKMIYRLEHGRIVHGLQFAAEGRRQPTTYYGPRSGVALALLNHPRESGLRVGIVGLGIGTLAAYGRKEDWFTFYEINPAVINIATSRFSYLSDSFATCDIIPGDARISLERQNPQNFDILVLDAFNSDAIPVHLLTLEAFATYMRHLKKKGILAVHITNRYLDLAPVMETLADRFKLETTLIESQSDDKKKINEADWMLLKHTESSHALDKIHDAASTGNRRIRRPILWTDDYSNLFQVLK